MAVDYQTHNYVKKMVKMQQAGELPRDIGVHKVTVWHDSWCGIYRQQRCNCVPEVSLAWSLPAHREN